MVLFIVTGLAKYMILPKIANIKNVQKFAHFDENWMLHCAVPIACRIPILHKNVHNNILYWKPEGFSDNFIVKKMTVSSKPLKRPKNGQFWELGNFFGGLKNFFRSKIFLGYIPLNN